MIKFPLFGRKEEEVEEEIPINDVIYMKRSGMSTNQIISTLQREGFSYSAIRKALMQADMKLEVGGPGYEEAPAGPPMFRERVPRGLREIPTPEGFEPEAVPEVRPMIPPPRKPSRELMEDIEELTEKIVEEKWRRLDETLDAVRAWRDDVEDRISTIREDISDIKDTEKARYEEAEAELRNLENQIKDLESRVLALERGFKAFREMMPEFTRGVKELIKATEKLKK